LKPELYTRLNEEVERKDTGEIVSAGIYFIEQPKEELLNLPSYAIYNEVKMAERAKQKSRSVASR